MSSKPSGLANSKTIDLTGSRFGRLVVVSFSHSKNGTYWKCRCDCGGESVVRAAALRSGLSKSCGCGSREAGRQNGHNIGSVLRNKYWPNTRKLKEMRRNMINRCYDPSNKRYNCYGGRGITVCDVWLNDRQSFYEWVIANGWRPGLEIDRRDVNGNYEPSNCRFVNDLVQANNSRHNHQITWDGETHSITEWARRLGVRGQALQHRFTRGWSVERAMTQPFRRWPVAR